MAIGVALFAIERRMAPADARPTVVITTARLAQLADNARRASAAAPDEQALLARAIDEEILHAEALARGLDRAEQSVEWRLAQKMRFLDADDCASDGEAGPHPALVREARDLELDRDDPILRGFLVQKMRYLLKRASSDSPPDDPELQAFLETHADRYRQPAHVTFWHVFLARDGAGFEHAAHQLLAHLHAQGTRPAEAITLGDAFPLGSHRRAQSVPEMTRLFGPDFARAITTIAPGTWAGPVRSVFGLHLVWVEAVEPAGLPPLDAVRSRVAAEWTDERRTARLDEAMRTLRAKYAVRVEPRADEP